MVQINGQYANTATCYTELMKLLIFVGIFVGGLLGGWVGALLSGGNWFSLISIVLSIVGSFAGIWGGFKAAQYFGFE